MRKVLAVGVLFFLFTGIAFAYEPGDVVKSRCSEKQEARADCSSFIPHPAKNVIVFVGDGMGLNAIYSGRVFKNGPSEPLSFEKFSHKSLIKTCSLSGVTDSAAAATALACGGKTYNGQIGTAADGRAMEDASELARKSGKSVGLVTTDSVVGATPSAFSLHEGSRFTFDNLVTDYLAFKPDALLGGGRQWFEKKSGDKSSIDKFKDLGYMVALNLSELEKAGKAPLLGLFADMEMNFVLDRKSESPEPELSQMVQKAIDLLSRDPEGFFLLVEAARIDHASHAGKFEKMLREVSGLDDAVKAARDFQTRNPDTLILVTSDHETGGLVVKTGDYKKGDVVKGRYTTGIPGVHFNHSAQKVGLFGEGPGAENVEKVGDNTQVFCVISRAITDHSEQTEEKGCECGK